MFDPKLMGSSDANMYVSQSYLVSCCIRNAACGGTQHLADSLCVAFILWRAIWEEG